MEIHNWNRFVRKATIFPPDVYDKSFIDVSRKTLTLQSQKMNFSFSRCLAGIKARGSKRLSFSLWLYVLAIYFSFFSPLSLSIFVFLFTRRRSFLVFIRFFSCDFAHQAKTHHSWDLLLSSERNGAIRDINCWLRWGIEENKYWSLFSLLMSQFISCNCNVDW